ncbi:unnamed protein product [Calypogeia fissa]
MEGLNSADELIGKTEKLAVKDEEQIPVIDMAVLEHGDRSSSGCKEMRESMARACEKWGFFTLINHGIDASLLEKVKEASIGFFKKPEEEKLQYQIRPGVIEGLYSRSVDVPSNKLTLSVDHLYYFTSPPSLTNWDRWPRDPPAYREALTEYAEQVRSIQEKLIGMLSEELGLEKGAFQERMTGDGETSVSFRNNYYRPAKASAEDPNQSDDLCLLAAHSDPGAFSVVLQNEAGLQVSKDGVWVGVDPVANALVVNIGDQIEILSNGRYRSVEHRGNADPTKERLSIATFYSPDPKAMIGPIKQLVDDAHPARYGDITYDDYISAFFGEGLKGKDYVKAAADVGGEKASE